MKRVPKEETAAKLDASVAEIASTASADEACGYAMYAIERLCRNMGIDVCCSVIGKIEKRNAEDLMTHTGIVALHCHALMSPRVHGTVPSSVSEQLRALADKVDAAESALQARAGVPNRETH